MPALGIECSSPRGFDGFAVSGGWGSGADPRWRDLFIEGGCERLSGGVSPKREEILRLKKELAESDQVICEQTIAVRVLKKTWETDIDGRVQSGCHGRAVAGEG